MDLLSKCEELGLKPVAWLGELSSVLPMPAFFAAGQMWRHSEVLAQVVEASEPAMYPGPTQRVRVMASEDIGPLPPIGSGGWVFVGMSALPKSVGHTVKIKRPT